MLLLSQILKRIVKVGQLTVVDHVGRSHVFAGGPGPAAIIRLHDSAAARQIARNPRLYFGETYMDGRMTLEGGDIYSFLEFCAHNETQVTPGSWLDLVYRLQTVVRRFQQFNPVSRARDNVAHHYDLSGQLYELFLDSDRQYSCAYFRADNDSLEGAQDNKKRHIAAKLVLKPGCKVLDIGSGWGGLGLYLAKVAGSDVTGITLSAEQHKVSNERAVAAGLAGRARFHLTDYRKQPGKFDRVVSVGMFEHVGVNHYGQFFRTLRNLMTDDGIAVLHAIGRADGPGVTNPWLRKYIFPGGYSPALSEVLPIVEKSGLFVTDIEILRLHYAETLREWRQRFARARDQVKALYDERFCRMWEFYLAGSELAFRYHGHIVWQMQLSRRIDAVPLTRDYMFEWERENVGRNIRAA